MGYYISVVEVIPEVKEVTEGPRILSGPETLSVKETESITITYNISAGQPTATATWMKVEETITANEKFVIDVTTETVSLTIKDAKPDDASMYTLKLENETASVTYSTTLTVIGMKTLHMKTLHMNLNNCHYTLQYTIQLIKRSMSPDSRYEIPKSDERLLFHYFICIF